MAIAILPQLPSVSLTGLGGSENSGGKQKSHVGGLIMTVEFMDLLGAPEREIGHSKKVLFRRTALGTQMIQ